ncbi:uncharacterized protein VTP21DRAFT_2379 [Calcarisporiella thermophila]|uniref:uncharacterized protein n=1 Tax=Calcarisporiella thermophila TaxID=911321 RepID=UPI0037421E77
MTNSPGESFQILDEADNEVHDCKLWHAMDEFLMCYSLGRQAMNYYRYGTMRNCDREWSEVKFCLKMKTKPAAIQKEMLKERERRKLAYYAAKRSSEDVWEQRDKPPAGYPLP